MSLSGETKSIFCHVTTMKFVGKQQLVYKFQLYLKTYNCCEYVQSGAISLKIDIL